MSRFGAEFALRSEFDEIRSYIVGEDIRHPEVLQENQIAVDSRFVEQSEDCKPFIATEGHTVMLTTHGPSLFAMVTLYGLHEYKIRLGEVLPENFLISITEYSITRQGYRDLSLDEIYQRVVERRVASVPPLPHGDA